jgi:signal transduction histidine kinase
MVAISMRAGTRSRLSGSIGNPFRLLISARPWLATVFLLGSFVSGVFWFCVLVTMLATGFGLAVTLIGLPLLGVTMLVWTLGARAERWWIGLLFNVRIVPSYRPLPAGSNLQRAKTFATDPAVWRDLCYLFLLFPIGIIEFVFATVVISVPLSMVTLPLYFWAIPGGKEIGSWSISTAPEAILVALAGVPLLLAMPYALVGMARGHLVLAQALLGSNPAALAERVDALTESRSRVMDAALAERRRIERDLHDGAQQRLVALAMELGMAKLKMDSDPEAAKKLVDEAHREAKLAMVEIRNLVQGIHPAVLTDRGLDAALSALAGRCPVPVAVIVEVEQRPPPVVESAAYFLVAEALTNIAKHSAATEASVVVRRVRGILTVEVADNGLGGADLTAGTGIAGLVDRVTALDGKLTVESPPGRGTRLRAEIPCGW